MLLQVWLEIYIKLFRYKLLFNMTFWFDFFKKYLKGLLKR